MIFVPLIGWIALGFLGLVDWPEPRQHCMAGHARRSSRDHPPPVPDHPP